jgi:hypothetical protein
MNKFFYKLYYINFFSVVVLLVAFLIDIIYPVMSPYLKTGRFGLWWFFDFFTLFEYITEFGYFFLAICFLLFLVKAKSWKDWEFEDGKAKIKTWLDNNVLKISFYFYIILGIIIFLKNCFYATLLIVSGPFPNREHMLELLTISVPVNILLFLFIFLFKKLKVQKFTESHLIIRIITVATFIIFAYFSFPEVYICATYFLTLLPHSFVGIFQLIGCSLINMC